MSAVQLLRFIIDNNIEIKWYDEELIIWPSFSDMDEFVKIVGYSFFSNGRFEVILKYDGLAFDLVPVCEYLGIEPTHILSKSK